MWRSCLGAVLQFVPSRFVLEPDRLHASFCVSRECTQQVWRCLLLMLAKHIVFINDTFGVVRLRSELALFSYCHVLRECHCYLHTQPHALNVTSASRHSVCLAMAERVQMQTTESGFVVYAHLLMAWASSPSHCSRCNLARWSPLARLPVETVQDICPLCTLQVSPRR